MNVEEIHERVETEGFAVISQWLDGDELKSILSPFEGIEKDESVRQRAGEPFGIRSVLASLPMLHSLAHSEKILSLIHPLTGAEPRVVRSLFFDKTPAANWKVPWHQDLTIAVREKRDVEGFGPWSVKAGVPHVQPPVAVMESMLAVRFHLDDCYEGNGPLRVLPGTHRLGRLAQKKIQALRNEVSTVVCEVPRGGVLVMRPLLLHASSPSESPRHRRVIHMEYSALALPGGLEWNEA